MPAAATPLISMSTAALAAPMPASVQWKPLGSASCVVAGAGVALRCGRYWPRVCSLIRLSAQGSICTAVSGRFWPNERSPLSGAEAALLCITALYAHGSRDSACAAGAAIAAVASMLPIHLRMRISASFVVFRSRHEPRECFDRLGGERAGAELSPDVVGVGNALDSRFPLSRCDERGAGAELGLT